MSTLVALCGTKYIIKRKPNDILFLENEGIDIGNLEKQVVQLNQNGYFDNVGAIIIGKYEFIKDYGLNRKLIDILTEVLDELPIIVSDFYSGHTYPIEPLFLGETYYLNAQNDKVILKSKLQKCKKLF